MISKNGKTVREEYGSYEENWLIVSQNCKAWGLSSKDVDRLILKPPQSDDVWLEDVRWVHAIRVGNDARYAEELVDARTKAIVAQHNRDVDLQISWKRPQIDMLAEKVGYISD